MSVGVFTSTLIASIVVGIYGEEVGRSIPVFYGGSINNENCTSLAEQKNIDGLFIGRSAWDADNFNKIIRSTLPIFKNK